RRPAARVAVVAAEASVVSAPGIGAVPHAALPLPRVFHRSATGHGGNVLRDCGDHLLFSGPSPREVVDVSAGYRMRDRGADVEAAVRRLRGGATLGGVDRAAGESGAASDLRDPAAARAGDGAGGARPI